MEFADKSVVVTGGGKGMGKTTALAFARKGANVIVADFDERALQEAVREIRNEGGTADGVAVDCSDEAGTRSYIDAAMSRYGRIDALFCNAGIRGKIGSLVAYEEQDFDDILRINLRSVFLGLRLALPIMVEQRSGAVVVTGSDKSLEGAYSMPGYVATKHGVLGLVRAAALDVASHGVRVNAVLPGATKTPLLTGLFSQSNPGNPDASADRYAATVPTGRLNEPEEIAAMTLYLCSDKARSVTGAYFLVDGGRLVGSMTTNARNARTQ